MKNLVILCRISLYIPGTCLLASYGNLAAENVEDVALLHCKRSAAGYALRNGPIVRAKETWRCALFNFTSTLENQQKVWRRKYTIYLASVAGMM
jgi:transposase-like protein